jgi:hypothetical protein
MKFNTRLKIIDFRAIVSVQQLAVLFQIHYLDFTISIKIAAFSPSDSIIRQNVYCFYVGTYK